MHVVQPALLDAAGERGRREEEVYFVDEEVADERGGVVPRLPQLLVQRRQEVRVLLEIGVKLAQHLLQAWPHVGLVLQRQHHPPKEPPDSDDHVDLDHVDLLRAHQLLDDIAALLLRSDLRHLHRPRARAAELVLAEVVASDATMARAARTEAG
jgi:hypothetical protein